jgi:hypothetical protein
MVYLRDLFELRLVFLAVEYQLKSVLVILQQGTRRYPQDLATELSGRIR